MTASHAYTAFISYRHVPRDAAIARQAHALIEGYVIPRVLRSGSRKLGRVFRDEEELPVSSDLSQSIRQALEASRYLIVICSPEALASVWIRREIACFLRTHEPEDVFIILASGEPADVFPPEITMNGAVEPLALDVRADSLRGSLKKLRAQIRKLYAAILHCPYGSLVQREKVRQMKRLSLAAALVLTLTGCFAAYVVHKNVELAAKNRQISEAMSATLLREAELLTAQAEEQLAQGNHSAAVFLAASALHDPAYDRPYHAPAESTLFRALNVFGSGQQRTMLRDLPITESSPIEMIAFSHDGSALFTIGVYGSVSCYDADTGELRWQTYLTPDQGAFHYNAPTQIVHDAASQLLICHYRGVLTALHAGTGTAAWESAVQGSLCSGLYDDAPTQTVSYIGMKHDFSGSTARYHYTFVSVHIGTGEIAHAIPLFEHAQPLSVWFPDEDALASSPRTTTGMFTDSGLFAGMVYVTENQICTSQLFVVDPAAETVRFIPCETLPRESDKRNHLRTFSSGNDVTVITALNQSPWGLRIRRFDLTSGGLLWDTTVTRNAPFIPSSASCFCLPLNDTLLVGAGSCLCVIDSHTGDVLAASTLQDTLVELTAQDHGMFTLLLANGHTALGWQSSHGLRDSSSLGAAVQLPAVTMAAVHRGGLLSPRVTGTQLQTVLSLPVSEGGGRIACVCDDRNTVHLLSNLNPPELPQPASLTIAAPELTLISSCPDQNGAGQALLTATDAEGTLGALLVDPGTRQAVWIPDPARAWSSLQLLLTGDGSSILASDRHGRLLRISRDGVVHTLSGDESIVLFEGAVGDDFFQFTGHRFASDSVRCSGTQQILSARCDGSEITLWLDGAAPRSIPLPRDLHWRSDDGIRQRSIFRAGPGGVLLLSHLASPSSQEVDSFAIFDPAQNAWRRIPDAARGSTDRLIALGESSPRFAVLDADRNIRIYHHAAVRPETCCAANLPYDSVQWLTFVLDDQYLLAGTRDGQMVVYAVADGAEVFRCRLTESRTNAAADFAVWHDPGNNRIYVRGGSHVRCFDAATWTELIHFDETDGALLFSPAFQQICLRRTELPSRALRLYMLPVPTTAELVSTAQQLMQ